MKRLLELPDGDRLTTHARSLVRAMGPTLESEERALRVRRSLDAPARATAPRWAWRATLAVGLLGAGAAAAATALSSRPPDPSRAATVAPLAPFRAKPAKPAAGPAIPATPITPPEPAPERATTPTTRTRPSHAAAPVVSDVARVHEAAKALRHDADPERALQLLERPGTRITGPLAEEALALRIEASETRGDGRAAKLAAAYLQQYPNGRYRELARKALAGHAR